eukprot:CAMPEP_0183352520 /NCGR_PEP_ID=MMETSP0164_2-20130417/29491_1 /TAXON_ID=221442 /ORGANISM="Coccolithus pelagicus ssp braarudi, Strain PLY182g" /LENGTH=83 /DNA_ID=CAMNT_0025524969 /DNA_START=335 /DNA_END=582 /DNA_ORIENTATION=-
MHRSGRLSSSADPDNGLLGQPDSIQVPTGGDKHPMCLPATRAVVPSLHVIGRHVPDAVGDRCIADARYWAAGRSMQNRAGGWR